MATQRLKKIKALLPALIENDRQEEMTEKSFRSLISFDNCLKVTIDKKRYDKSVAGVWNAFFDKHRGCEYDYLLITANDVEHDPNMVDFLVKYAERHKDLGVVSCMVTRDLEEFKHGFGQQVFIDRETKALKDPATFLIRKGVIEEVGRIDEYFPFEFVERDFLYRCKLAGFGWGQPDLILSYHPDHSGTIGNDINRLNASLKRYVSKWGGDADAEIYKHPFNNLNLNYKYCVE